MAPAPTAGASSSDGAAGGSGGSSGQAAGGRQEQRPLQPPRGLVLSLMWLTQETTVTFVDRVYDAAGQLTEVRHGTAVKGGWSGGRM